MHEAGEHDEARARGEHGFGQGGVVAGALGGVVEVGVRLAERVEREQRGGDGGRGGAPQAVCVFAARKHVRDGGLRESAGSAGVDEGLEVGAIALSAEAHQYAGHGREPGKSDRDKNDDGGFHVHHCLRVVEHDRLGAGGRMQLIKEIHLFTSETCWCPHVIHCLTVVEEGASAELGLEYAQSERRSTLRDKLFHRAYSTNEHNASNCRVSVCKHVIEEDALSWY